MTLQTNPVTRRNSGVKKASFNVKETVDFIQNCLNSITIQELSQRSGTQLNLIGETE
jgi:hypothetical protein